MHHSPTLDRYYTDQPLDVADLMDRLDDDHPATLQPLNPFSTTTAA